MIRNYFRLYHRDATGAGAEMSDMDGPGSALGDLQRELYFPTHIYFRDFQDGAELNARIAPAILAWRDEHADGIVRSNARRAGSWHSALDMNKRPEFDELTQRIQLTATEIFRDAGYDPATTPRIDNMWANINPPGGYNRSHIHPNSLWSGVYYVQSTDESGQIVFIDPRTEHLMTNARYDPSTQRDRAHWTEVFFKPLVGRLILFPSWLYHEVEANKAEGEGPEADRISVSFNIYQRRGD